MSFFKTAWESGAAEYGRKRAESYGRRAKGVVVLGLLAAGVLIVGILAAAQGALGG